MSFAYSGSFCRNALPRSLKIAGGASKIRHQNYLMLSHDITTNALFVTLCVRQPNDAKIYDYHLAYMSFLFAFSYISHKFTSTQGLQFSPRIVTCSQ